MNKFKYLQQSYGQLSLENLKRVESKIGSLPKEYASLLLRENGGVTDPREDEYDDFVFFGIHSGTDSLDDVWDEFKGVYGLEHLPVAKDPNGNHLLINK